MSFPSCGGMVPVGLLKSKTILPSTVSLPMSLEMEPVSELVLIKLERAKRVHVVDWIQGACQMLPTTGEQTAQLSQFGQRRERARNVAPKQV
jgi:hypothetical protein